MITREEKLRLRSLPKNGNPFPWELVEAFVNDFAGASGVSPIVDMEEEGLPEPQDTNGIGLMIWPIYVEEAAG